MFRSRRRCPEKRPINATLLQIPSRLDPAFLRNKSEINFAQRRVSNVKHGHFAFRNYKTSTINPLDAMLSNDRQDM